MYFSTVGGKLVKIDLSGNVIWTFTSGQLGTTGGPGREILFFAGTTNTQFYLLHDDGDQVRVVSKEAAPSNCCPAGGPVLVGTGGFAWTGKSGIFPVVRTSSGTETLAEPQLEPITHLVARLEGLDGERRGWRKRNSEDGSNHGFVQWKALPHGRSLIAARRSAYHGNLIKACPRLDSLG